MNNNSTIEPRRLEDGNWYWVDKSVIQNYGPTVGAVGILVYNYLASMADSSQTCFPSQRRIAETLGYSRATVNRAIARLVESGLIQIDKQTSTFPQKYRLLRIRWNNTEDKLSKPCNRPVTPANTNNTSLTRLNNNIARQNDGLTFNGKKSPGHSAPTTREELLAFDLADSLNDPSNLPSYLSYCHRLPESLIRRTLAEVKEVPISRIRKSRAALFNHLIKVYAKQSSIHLSD